MIETASNTSSSLTRAQRSGVVRVGAAAASLVASLVVLFACVPDAQAQDGGIVTPSDAQIQLYTEGAQAFSDGDYKKAIRLFKASLDLGELNITHLNLGRAFYKDGDCVKAQEHYDLAIKAPKIAEPTPAQVKGKVDQYRADLTVDCPGTLEVACMPSTMKLEIDGGDPVSCTDQPITLSAGKHVVIGRVDGQERSEKVDIEPLKASKVTISIAVADKTPEAPRVDKGTDPLLIAGWSTVGSGGAILLATFLYDALVLLPKLDDYKASDGLDEDLKGELETGQTIIQLTYGIGVAATVTGVVLILLSDSGEESSTPTSSVHLSPWASGEAAGVGVHGSW